jgi:hypothetical protein
MLLHGDGGLSLNNTFTLSLRAYLPSVSFYVNLPIGGLAILVIFIYYRTPAYAKPVEATWREKLFQMDFPGTVLILVALLCFLLAMQWAGVTKAWGSADVIAVLVMSGVLTIAFVVLEYFQNERSLLIPRLMKNRTTAACCMFIFLYVYSLSKNT